MVDCLITLFGVLFFLYPVDGYHLHEEGQYHLASEWGG